MTSLIVHYVPCHEFTGLFHRAISQSGTALSPWTIWPRPEAQAKLFASKLKCPTEKSDEMVSCMKSRSMQEIMIVHKEMMVRNGIILQQFVSSFATLS